MIKLGFYMIRKKNGFTLIELILVISIAAAMSFLSFQKFMQEQEISQANAAGEQLKKVGDAVNSYVAVILPALKDEASSQICISV